MDPHTQEVKEDIRKSVEDVKSLLDALWGRLRDAGSDTKETFAAISKDVEQLARDMSVASSHAFTDLVQRLRELVDRLGTDLRR